MKTKLKGNVRYFQYKGDILKEMQKCEKELEKISNELPMYEQIYNKAKKEYENKRKRKIKGERKKMIILIEILKIILYAIYSVFIKSVSYLVSLLILILIIVIVCYLTKLIVSDLKRRVKIYGKH